MHTPSDLAWHPLSNSRRIGYNGNRAVCKKVGLERKLYGFRASGYVGVLGQIDTGHRLDLTGVCVPRIETTADGFISGKISANEWNTVAKDNWADAGPVNSGLINNAIKSVQITRKTLIKGVYTPDEVVNKAEYKAMRQAFNSLPLDKQGKAIKQIVTAWSLACQVFPVNLKNEIGRVTERVADDFNLAFILNESASKLSKATKDVEVANEVIKETVKAINQVNQKITSKRTQQKSQADLMSKKQKEVADLKKLFKNHSYHPIQDAQRAYDDARNKVSLLERDIISLQKQVSELNVRKKQAEQKIAAAAKVKAEAAAEKKAAEAKAKAEAEKVKKEIETKANDEKAVLTKASEIIISVGDKVGDYLGDNYKTLSREISENIKNFQGKTIRSYDEAMTSINKLMVNPSLKINTADKDAIVNAWKAFDAEDMGNKFAMLGKSFRAADYVVKANNVRVKSIEGYQTGNWGPLVREVESWVISGIASAVALKNSNISICRQ